MKEAFGNYIQADTIVYVLFYYFVFWLINVAAYSGVALGLYRWIQFIEGTGMERIAKATFRIALSFACIRFVSGTLGLLLFEFGHITWLETIVFLGVISLLLNTTFITLEAFIINREAKVILNLGTENRALMKSAIVQFNSLRNTIDKKKL